MLRLTSFLAALVVLVGVGDTLADPVQWRVEDGGNGHWYEAVVNPYGPLEWSDAHFQAEAVGGYLATITSQAENDFVFGLVNDDTYWNQLPSGYHGPWLGGRQEWDTWDWGWVTGEPWGYTNWAPNEPNDDFGRTFENRMHFWSAGSPQPAAVWGDTAEFGTYGVPPLSYVVEVVPEPSTLVLLAMGVVGLLAWGWRRRFIARNLEGGGVMRWFTASLVLLCASLGRADVLDWDLVEWTPDGALSQSYVDVDGSGVDISFLIEPSDADDPDHDFGHSSPLTDEHHQPRDPDEDGIGDKSLVLVTDYDDRTTEYHTYEVQFSPAVRNVEFLVFDVDVSADSTRVDELTIDAFLGGNGVPVSIVGSPKNVVVGNTVTGIGSNSEGEDLGDAFISISNPIDRMEILYRNAATTGPLDSSSFGVCIHDISFNAIPEPSTFALLFMGCLSLLIFAGHRRRLTRNIQGQH